MTRYLIAAAALAVVLAVVWPRAAWLALRGLVAAAAVVLAELVERRRARRAPPRVALPAVRAWHVRLLVPVGGRLVAVTQGKMVGPWTSAAEVEAEAACRALRRAAAAGYAGRVYARARPLAPATRPEVGRRS